jgi:large subunit ribosomal protein L4
MMHRAPVYRHDGEKAGEVELPQTVFEAPSKKGAVYYAVKGYLANVRRGTASAKTRGDVSYSGAKPWRQKGTGRARVGSRGSAIWVGGGVAMGPKPKDYSLAVPKKVRRTALKSALSNLAAEGKVVVVEELRVEEPKTRVLAELIQKMGITAGSRCLILLDRKDDNLKLSLRNIPFVESKLAKDVNALDVLKCGHMVATRKSLEQLAEVFSA